MMNPLRRVNLVIIRRYVDMNGRYVGELYLDGMMIGASLDDLPLGYGEGRAWFLDTRKSFLKPLGWRTVRVGGLEPGNDRFVRQLVRSLPRLNMWLRVENRFVDGATGAVNDVVGKGAV